MPAKVIIIMGVSASGKTTIGQMLAFNNNFLFVDGDDLHSEKNIKKMKSGVALNDADREAWFINIIKTANEQLRLDKTVVIACSALKKKYRDILRAGIQNLLFVYLKISFNQALLQATKRKNHFMPAALLKSQFEILEAPAQEEKDIITVIPAQTAEKTVNEIQVKVTG